MCRETDGHYGGLTKVGCAGGDDDALTESSDESGDEGGDEGGDESGDESGDENGDESGESSLNLQVQAG